MKALKLFFRPRFLPVKIYSIQISSLWVFDTTPLNNISKNMQIIQSSKTYVGGLVGPKFVIRTVMITQQQA